MSIAADLIRPAAIEQLRILAEQCQVDMFALENNNKATKTVSEGLMYASANGFDTVIIDTAGRLHVDKQLMNELVEIKKIAKPNDILLTVDALTGQDIVNVAKEFDKYFVAEDCGGAIKGNKIDIFMNSESECNSWGRRSITIQILD